MSFTTECMDLQTLLFNLNMIKYGTKMRNFPFNLIKKGILSHSCLLLTEFLNSLRSMLSYFELHNASHICNWGQVWTFRGTVKHLHFWDLDSLETKEYFSGCWRYTVWLCFVGWMQPQTVFVDKVFQSPCRNIHHRIMLVFNAVPLERLKVTSIQC